MFTQMCAKAKATLGALKRDERGVSALEYTILAVVVVGAVILAAPSVVDMYKGAFDATKTKVSEQISGYTPPAASQ